MKISVKECPCCGARLEIKEERPFVYCEYCGSQIRLEEAGEKYEFIDRARLKEAEVESQRIEERRWDKERYLEDLAKWQKLRNICLVAIVVLLAAILLFGSNSGIGHFFSAILSCSLVAGLIVWKIKPKEPGYLAGNPSIGQGLGGSPTYSGQRGADRTGTGSYKSYGYSQPGQLDLPWYCQTGWIILLGLVTGGLYWIAGPVLRVSWKKRH